MKADTIDKVLPQTQCKECGFNGCAPYAEAIADGTADIDLCPPGGVETLISLASITKKDAAPYLDAVKENTRQPTVAKIREEECIGCTKCIQACPVDAIIGSNKQMHTVVADLCTGCNLCVEPCPVDCIELQAVNALTFDKDQAKARFNKRNERLENIANKKREHYQAKRNLTQNNDKDAKKAYIMNLLKKKQTANNQESR